MLPWVEAGDIMQVSICMRPVSNAVHVLQPAWKKCLNFNNAHDRNFQECNVYEGRSPCKMQLGHPGLVNTKKKKCVDMECSFPKSTSRIRSGPPWQKKCGF